MSARQIHIFEVGVRDGLQNEKKPVSFDQKIRLVNDLLAAGVRNLELGAFVRPDRVPKMADTERVYEAIRKHELKLGRARAWSLVPNMKGLQRALAVGARQIAVFTAATESFARANIGMSIAESMKEYAQVISEARRHGVQVRGYVSTVFGCPFEGKVSRKKALSVIDKLASLGVMQVSIGDTIGMATPGDVDAIAKPVLRELGVDRVAMHFHDTRGTALANTLRSLELGVTTFDSSAGGLGGCPFAPGATGNLATEDLVFMLDGMGLKSGIDLQALCRANLDFAARIRRPLSSRYMMAFASQCGSRAGRRATS